MDFEDIASALEQAETLLSSEKYGEAAAILERVCECYEKKGYWYLDYADTKLLLAGIYRDYIADKPAALKHFSQLVRSFKKEDSGDPFTMPGLRLFSQALLGQAFLSRDLGDVDGAKTTFLELRALFVKELGEDSEEVKTVDGYL